MKRSNGMLHFIMLFLITFSIFVCANVFLVSIGKIHLRSKTDLTPYIVNVNTVKDTIHASRGYIYDSNGIVVAQDEKRYNILCFLDKSRVGIGNKPAYVEDPIYTARVLSTVLEVDENEVLTYLTNAISKNLYQTELGLLGKNITTEEKEKIEEYKLPGIEFTETIKRNYPLGQYFSPYLLGYTQLDENNEVVGRMGVEAYLDTELSGVDGTKIYQADKNGYILPGMRENITPAIDGYDVHLTIDSVIQGHLNTCINELYDLTKAVRVWGTLVEVDSGKIIAYDQYPSFNPNDPVIKDYNDYNAQYVYEPGSVYKTFTYAAAVNEGKYDKEALIDTNPFCFTSDENLDPHRTYAGDQVGCLYNYAKKTYGHVSYDFGLQRSLNTVTCSVITDLIKPSVFFDYLNRFKLLEAVKTDGIPTNVGSTNFYYASEKLTTTYGHGVTTTALNLVQAYTAIYGNGEMVKPYYIESITNPNDNDKVIYKAQREVIGNPISESTAKELQRILETVVSAEGATARMYKSQNVRLMCKTGTSDVASKSGYDNASTTISSAMFGFPYENPKYIFYIAYEMPYTKTLYPAPIKKFINNVALVTNLSENLGNAEDIVSDYEEYDMPSLSGHSVAYAKEKLSEIGVNSIIIGDGDSVIKQYPNPKEKIYSNQKVYLLTKDSDFKMIDLNGFTRKEVTEVWNLLGIPFTLDGYGKVYEQSIAPGDIVTKDSHIIVKFKDPAKP